MKGLKIYVVLLLFTAATAAPLPPATAILTEVEIRAAAEDVPVARVAFTVPEIEMEAEEALAKRFFEDPQVHRYSGLTNTGWPAKWQLFSGSLIANAKRGGFDATSLEACLRALNRGRNRQTMLWPIRNTKIWFEKTTTEEMAAFEKKAEEDYEALLKEREKNPERWYDQNLAIVPVGAYLGRHKDSDCWIIVCRWEMASQGEASPLAHVKVWALDAKTASVVGFVTCD